MLERITMNSKSLQKKFPEIYRELFSRCSIVLSANCGFFWEGCYISFFGGPIILQKIPKKIYVGLEPCPDNNIIVESEKIYNPVTQKFDNNNFFGYKKYKIEKRLNKFVKVQNIGRGFKLHIIAEVSDGHGLLARRTATTLAITTILLYGKILSQEDILRWQKLLPSELAEDKKFKEIFVQILRFNTMDCLLTSGCIEFLTIVNHKFPILYSFENKTIDHEKMINNPTYERSWQETEFVEKTSISVLGIDEIFNNKDDCFLHSLDIFTIYSGQMETITRPKENLYLTICQNIKYINDLLNKTNNSMFDKSMLKNLKPTSNIDKIKNSYSYVETNILLGLLKAFSRFFTGGLLEEDIRKLTDLVNTSHNFLNVLTEQDQNIELIRSLFVKKARILNSDLVFGSRSLTYSSVSSKGGDILFIVQAGKIRDEIDNILKEIKNAGVKNACLHYASWLDGYEEEGVKVEQYLEKGIYSGFISKGSILVKSWDQNTEGQSNLYSIDEFQKEKDKIDLLLDSVEKTIYIKGKKLTSQDIQSSKTTIKVMQVLLENIGKSIQNSQLPQSSYSQDRNEFQGKIASLFIKAVKKYAEKDLLLDVTGGITEFRVGLQSSNMKIVIIEKKM